VLLHTEVPQRFSGQGVGSRLAHAVFETLKARGRRVIAKCPFMSGFATNNPEYLAILDG
jgi:predicted GNAT family acetyltransferase